MKLRTKVKSCLSSPNWNLDFYSCGLYFRPATLLANRMLTVRAFRREVSVYFSGFFESKP